jgi:hypothetical protein
MAAGYWLRVIHWLPGTGCRVLAAVRLPCHWLPCHWLPCAMRIEATG